MGGGPGAAPGMHSLSCGVGACAGSGVLGPSPAHTRSVTNSGEEQVRPCVESVVPK